MKPVCVIGAGGHAKAVIGLLRAGGYDIGGAIDNAPRGENPTLLDAPVFSENDFFDRYPPGSVALVNGVGSVAGGARRRNVFEAFSARGYDFATVTHPSGYADPSATLGSGCQIMAGAVVQVSAALDVDVIVNTGASVDHDCRIGAHTHIAPGATLSGDVAVGPDTLIGCGATVIQGVVIGAGVTVGAGAVVTKDISNGTTVVGVPARQA